MTNTQSSDNDFLTAIRGLIFDDKVDEAVRQITSLDGMEQQLNITFSLVHTLTRALDRELDMARDRAQGRDKNLDRDLARDLVLVRALTRALDRDLARARDRAFYLARALTRDPVRTQDLARALDLDLVLVRALSLDLDLGLVLDMAYDKDTEAFKLIQREHNTVKTIVRVLEYRPQEGPVQVTLAGLPCTVINLVQYGAPFLQALTNIQKLIAEITGQLFVEPQVMTMQPNNFEIEVDGLSDAIHTANRVLAGYRRNQAEEGRELAQQLRQIQAERLVLESEYLLKEVEIERDPVIKAPDKAAQLAALASILAEKKAEIDRREAEVKGRQREYHKSQMHTYRILGNTFIDVVAPTLPADRRSQYLPRLIHELQVLAESPLTMQVGPSIPPPPPN